MQPVWLNTPLIPRAPSHAARLLGVVGQIEHDFLGVVVVEVGATTTLSKFLNCALSARSAFLLFFFLGLLLGFRRFLVVGPARARRARGMTQAKLTMRGRGDALAITPPTAGRACARSKRRETVSRATRH